MKIYNTLRWKNFIIALSLLCYLLTCGFLPYCYDEANNLYYGDGIGNLFFGWISFVFPGIFPKICSLAWFSNITYIVAIRCLNKENRKQFILWVCITLALDSLLAFCPKTEADVWGNTTHHFILTMGYYLKMISFLILLIGGMYVLFERNGKKGYNLKKEEQLESQLHNCKKIEITK